MKKLLLIALAVAGSLAICWGAAVAVDNHYKQNKKHETPVVTKQQADFEVASVKVGADEKYKALVAQFNGQVAECQKGKVAYDKLTPFIKTQLGKDAAPVCAAALVQ